MSTTALVLPFAWNFVVPAFLGLMASASYLAAYGLVALVSIAVLGLLLVGLGHLAGLVVVERVGLALLALVGFFGMRQGARRVGRSLRRRRGAMLLSDLEEMDRGWAGDELVDLAMLSRAGLPVVPRRVSRGQAPDTQDLGAVSGRFSTRDPEARAVRFAVWSEEGGPLRRVDRLLRSRVEGQEDAPGSDPAAVANAVEGILGAAVELRYAGTGADWRIHGCARIPGPWDALWIAAGAGADLAGDPIVQLERDLVETGHGWDRLLLGAADRASREAPLVRFEAGRPYLDFERTSRRPLGASSVRDWIEALRWAFARRRPVATPSDRGIAASLDAVARMRAIVREHLVPMATCARRVEECLAAIAERGDGGELDPELVAWVMRPELAFQHRCDAALRAIGDPSILARLEGSADWPAFFEGGEEAHSGAVRTFLAAYGHRGPGERTLGGERWDDRPLGLAAAIRGAMRTGPAEAARPPRRPRWSSWPVAFLARRLVACRLEHREAATAATRDLHRALVEHGRQWVQKERLERPEDLLHLTLDEWRGLESGPWAGPRRSAETAKLRRLAHEALRDVSAPTVLGDVGDPSTEDEGAPSVHGIACGGGRVRGRVHRVERPGATLPDGPGWIVVLPDANPHFARALGPEVAGLVCERGGPLCHLAVVAREHGIPAVMAAIGSVDRFGDGQEVWLDADRGVVQLAGD